MFEIVKITNKNTGDDVCTYYWNKPIKSIYHKVGKEIKVFYEDGSFFTHEQVVDRKPTEYGVFVETTNKFWCFKEV